MTYSKTQWENGVPPALNADNLNKIEQGIFDNDSGISTVNEALEGKAAASHTHSPTDLTSAVPVNKGGTGSDTATGAVNNLFQSVYMVQSISTSANAGTNATLPYPAGITQNDVLAIKSFNSGYSGIVINAISPETDGLSVKIRNVTSVDRTCDFSCRLLCIK